MSISVLSGDELNKRGIGDFKSLAQTIPGLAVVDDGAITRRIYIRGVGNVFGNGSQVGIYLDEASLAGSPLRQINFQPYDLARVEVLKGPQGTLYGAGSMGGTIRFISNSPQLDQMAGNINLTGSTTKGGGSSQAIGGMVNIPVVEDVFGMRLSGVFENAGGWIDQPTAGKKDINEQEIRDIRFRTLWQATDNLRIQATINSHRNDGSPNAGEDENGNFEQVLGRLTTPSVKDDFDIYNLTATYEFDRFMLTSSSSQLTLEKRARQRKQNFPTGLPPAPVRGVLHEIGDTDIDIFSQELRLSSKGSGKLQWTTGIFYRDYQYDRDTQLLFGQTGVFEVPILLLSTERSKSWAVFGDVSYAVTDRLDVGFGLRYFEDEQEDNNKISMEFQQAPFDALSPKVYLKYSVSDTANIFASVSEGFRSGGFNDLGEPSYGPEEILSYEIGTKMVFWDGQLTADMAVFYSDYTDYQVAGILPPPALPLSITSNGGDVVIKGLDWMFNWQVNEGLSLIFNGNYVDATFDKIAVLNSAHIIGDEVDYIPKNTYALSANYDFDWQGNESFIRLDYNRYGSSYLRLRNIGDYFQSKSDVIEMLNLSAELKLNRSWMVGMFVDNILDDRGYTDPAILENFASRSRPRSFGVKVGVEF